jgi:hypothetical protein
MIRRPQGRRDPNFIYAVLMGALAMFALALLVAAIVS